MALIKSPGILVETIKVPSHVTSSDLLKWYSVAAKPLGANYTSTFITTSARHRASDIEEHTGFSARAEWMSIYSIVDSSKPESGKYWTLETSPQQSQSQQRDPPTSENVEIEQRIYELVSGWPADVIDGASDTSVGDVLITLNIVLKPERHGKEVESWYSEEHVPMVSQVPGWLRTRLFRMPSRGEQDGKAVEYFTLHEYARENGLEGPEFKAALQTPRAVDMQKELPKRLTRRIYFVEPNT